VDECKPLVPGAADAVDLHLAQATQAADDAHTAETESIFLKVGGRALRTLRSAAGAA
jgi:hypothetical protein